VPTRASDARGGYPAHEFLPFAKRGQLVVLLGKLEQ